MKSPPRRDAGLLTWICVLSATIWSCNLDTTPPGELPHFAPAWQLTDVDGRLLPDTLSLSLENSPPNTLHEIEAGALEFTFPRGTRLLRWTLVLMRLTDSARFAFSMDARYVQVGADSLEFPISRSVPPEFFGRQRADTMTINVIWLEDPTTPAALVGGTHVWRFARDTLFNR
jgi:hypothetical protein